MRIAVIGFGYVGSILARRLSFAGHHVFAVKRSPLHLVDPGNSGITAIQADVTDRASLSNIPTDLDHVVYAVAPGAREDEAYRRAYPLGIEHMLDASPTAHFTFVSSTAVYSQENGEDVDETSKTEATSFSSQRLLEAEEILLADPRQHTIVRSSGIYGPGRTRLISQLAHCDLDEDMRKISTSRIHRDDLAACLDFLVNRHEADKNAAQAIYVASDPSPATLGEMQDWAKMQSGNWGAAGGATSTFVGRDRKSRRILPTRLLKEGFRFQYQSFREGYAALQTTT